MTKKQIKEYETAVKKLITSKIAVQSMPALHYAPCQPDRECFGSVKDPFRDKVRRIIDFCQFKEGNYYYVEWEMREDGFVPIDSYAAQQELKDSGSDEVLLKFLHQQFLSGLNQANQGRAAELTQI